MPVSSKDLLDHLTDLQLALEDYSFGEMTTEEAMVVRKSFEHFRSLLESRLWDSGGPGRIPGPAFSNKDALRRDGALEAVGHDLRNPLHGLAGFARILAEAPIEEPYKSIAASVQLVAECMTDTVEELRGFSQVKNGGGPSVQVPFSPKSVLEETTAYARMQLLGRPVEVELECEENVSGLVVGNPSDMRRVLMHLTDNACRFTRSGRIRVVAGLSEEGTGPELRVSISDTGIGIPQAELPHVFKPYYQGKQPMDLSSAGTGFGLSIVRQLVGRQGGKIEIQSRAGRGTTVNLSVPYSSPKDVARERKKELNTYRNKLDGLRVLVLENDPLNLQLLQSRLGILGCDVFAVQNIGQAILLLESEPMDVFLLDVRLQNKKDHGSLSAIRRHRNLMIREFPILLMSADPRDASRDTIQQYGVEGLLLKPFTLEGLFKKLSDFLGNRHPEASLSGDPYPNGDREESLVDLSALQERWKNDPRSLNVRLHALQNSMLEFAGRTRLAINRRDYRSIAADSEKVLAALELIRAQCLIPVVNQIRLASMEGVDENKIVRAYSEYLARLPEVAGALDRYMGRA